MDRITCLRFEAIKDFPCDDDYFFRKGEIFIETFPTSMVFKRENDPTGKHGLSLNCFSDKQQEEFLKEISPIDFKETKNYKEYFKNIWENNIKDIESEIERCKDCIKIHKKSLEWYKNIIEEE